MNVSVQGMWLFVRDRELFLSFAEFPWFRDAAIGAISNVQLPSPNHLYWPDLDIDLAVESIEHPEKYPLVSNAGQKVEPPMPHARRPAKAKRQTRAPGA